MDLAISNTFNRLTLTHKLRKYLNIKLVTFIFFFFFFLLIVFYIGYFYVHNFCLLLSYICYKKVLIKQHTLIIYLLFLCNTYSRLFQSKES